MSAINQITVGNTTYDVEEKRTVWSSTVQCSAGSTYATINDAHITYDSIIEPFIDDNTGVPVSYTMIVNAVGNTTVYFPPLTRGAGVRVRITNLSLY